MAPIGKKRKSDQLSEITFDPAARQEYLSGFHKRKVARKEHARDVAIKREKEDRVIERKKLREQRKADLEKHVTDVNAELRKQRMALDGSDTESGPEPSAEAEESARFEEPEPVGEIDGQEDEYVDEDKYTTVTVEAMEPSDGELDTAEAEAANVRRLKSDGRSAPAKKGRQKLVDGKKKPKKKKFRYESKGERKDTRDKQKAKNKKQALARKSQS